MVLPFECADEILKFDQSKDRHPAGPLYDLYGTVYFGLTLCQNIGSDRIHINQLAKSKRKQ